MLKLLVFLLLLFESSQGSGVCDCNLDKFRGQYICLCENLTITNRTERFEAEILHEGNLDNGSVTTLSITDSLVTVNSPILLKTFPNTQNLALMNVGLESLVKFDDCSKLLLIIIYNNRIKSLDAGIFDDCGNLMELIVPKNEIAHIDSAAFKALGKLERFDLTDNFISSIAQKTFSSLVNLHTIYLSCNRIRFIQEGTFSNMKALEMLYINDNNLTKLHPETFKGLNNLTRLSIGDNQIKTLAGNLFETNKNLESLDLRRNQINATDPLVFRNLSSSLRYLYMFDNDCIDKDFAMIKDFEREVLSELGRCFENFAASSAVPDNAVFCHFRNHSELGYTCELSGVIYGDQNDSFPVSGEHLSGLNDGDVRAIVVANSTLAQIPTELLIKFPSAEILIAQNVNLQRLDEATLRNCNNLRHVDFSRNQIARVTDRAFESCGKLASIDLSINKISALPAKLFTGNPDMESIDLDKNLISKIEPCNNVLRSLSKLTHLSLKWNICISNSFRHPMLHLLFDRIVSRDIRICFGFWYM